METGQYSLNIVIPNMNKWNGIERRSNWTNATNRDIRLIELKEWIQNQLNEFEPSADYWDGYEQGFLDVIKKINLMEGIHE